MKETGLVVGERGGDKQKRGSGRYGKMVTIVEGIDDSAIDIGKLAKLLKGACASGGTVSIGEGYCCDSSSIF